MTTLVSPPVVTINPSNITAMVCESVTFYCSATGFGEFSIVWEFNHTNVSEPQIVNQDNYTITSVKSEHQGQYRCNVTSLFSKNMSTVAFTTLQLKGTILCILYVLF